ncbi:hypothetical protein D3C74_25260 [compost metagenome]
MGVDAYVVCNCVKEGNVKPPPFDLSLLEITVEGIDILESVNDETYELYQHWRENACEHEDFYYYQDRVFNIAGGNFFYGIIDRLGQGKFPLLISIGEKLFSADQAEKALKELDVFESGVSKLQGVFLVDTESNDEYGRSLSGEDKWFLSSGGEHTYQLNDRGFCILDRDQRELFHSVAFTQKVLSVEEEGRKHKYARIQDLETGQVVESSYPLSRKIWGIDELYFPKSFQVVKRNLKGSDSRSTRVLRSLFEASLQTGNPIIWA